MTGPSACSRCTGSSARSAPVARCAYPRSRSSPMNWSTRLRRWVRIRTPPVRVASTKPMAATVLPAPVACSNQKRLAALGSSGASSSWSSSSGTSAESVGSSACGSSSSSSSSSSSNSASTASRSSSTASTGSAAACAAPSTSRLGEQRGERARQRVDLVRVQQRAVGEARLLLRQEPLEPEQERPGARPLRGRVREAVVELAQGGVERAAAVGAGCEDLDGVLPGQHEPFARELLRALDLVGGGDGRGREGHWREISQGGVRNSDGRAEARAGKPGEQTPVWHCVSTAEDLRKT